MNRIIAAIILLILLTINCSPNEPINSLTLSVDVSCTEAWVNISTNNVSLPQQLEVTRNGETAFSLTLSANDTTIYDDNLLPNKSYTYQAILTSDKLQVTSNKVAVTTLDTTSHNFTWQTFTFGEHSSCILYDVAIINENNIWAVGEIYMKDSTGQIDQNAYNAVHWDGSKWELLRILVKDYGNLSGYFPLQTVFAFSENRIWFAGYADLIKWDGKKYESKAFFMNSIPFNGQVNKIWGESENNLYCVGNSGAIYHYTGTSWQKIESGSELTIQDIWSSTATHDDEILCIASEIYNNIGNKLMRIENNSTIAQSTNGLPWSLSSIWFSKGRKYYMAGDGIYEKNKLTDQKWKNKLGITNYYINRIRGNDINDVIAVGAYGETLHYNGKTWKSYMASTYVDGGLKSVSIKNNTIAAVGTKGRQAVVIIGRR